MLRSEFRQMRIEPCRMIGAQERTRTSTPLRELAPEASASANSATWAFGAACLRQAGKTRQTHIDAQAMVCQRSTPAEQLLTCGNAVPNDAFMSLVSSVETLLCLSFGWGMVSLLLCFRSWRDLGLGGEGRLRLYSGPRPSDPDELRAWRLGWHFMFGVLATMLCMIAIPVAWWLSGK
jgi:hypothetical protein